MTANTTTRRGLLKSLPAIIAAPAIVRIASIMPVKAWHFDNHGILTDDLLLRATNPWWGDEDAAMLQLLQERMTDAERVFNECLRQHWENLWRQPDPEHARRMIELLESKDDDQDAGSTP